MDMKADITNWAKISGIKIDDLKNRIIKITTEEYMSAFKGKELKEKAWIVVKGQLSKSFSTESGSYMFICLNVFAPVNIHTKKGDTILGKMIGLGKKKLEDDTFAKDIELITVTGYGEDANVVNDFEEKKIYETAFEKKGRAIRMVKDITKATVVDEKFPNVPKLLNKLYEHIDIADLYLNISEDRYDMKLIYGSVSGAATPISKKGRELGIYNMIDNSLTPEVVQESRGLAVFTDPSQIKYAEGSTLYILGSVHKNEEDKISVSANMIYPEIGITLNVGVHKVEDKEIDDIDDEDFISASEEFPEIKTEEPVKESPIKKDEGDDWLDF